MTSNNYTKTRPRIRVDDSARNRLRWFSDEYELPLDRVYGLAFERLAERIENSEADEIAEVIENNDQR